MTLTVEEFLRFTAPHYCGGPNGADAWTFPAWPPDLFLIAASTLHRSGAYLHAFELDFSIKKLVKEIDPGWRENDFELHEYCDFLALEWRRYYPEVSNSVSLRPYVACWDAIYAQRATPLSSVQQNVPLVKALLACFILTDSIWESAEIAAVDAARAIPQAALTPASELETPQEPALQSELPAPNAGQCGEQAMTGTLIEDGSEVPATTDSANGDASPLGAEAVGDAAVAEVQHGTPVVDADPVKPGETSAEFLNDFDGCFFKTWIDEFGDGNDRYLGTTLCKNVHPSRGRVIPKTRTPRSGLTLRALSMHLAYCPPSEVSIGYHMYVAEFAQAAHRNSGRDEDAEEPVASSDAPRGLNLLLIPWPERVTPSDFRPVGCSDYDKDAQRTRRFAYGPRSSLGTRKLLSERVLTLIDKAIAYGGWVDGLVFPETALDEGDYKLVANYVRDERIRLLIAGIRANANGRSRNLVSTFLNVSGEVHLRQGKHHRWYLDESQILGYGLGSQLHAGDRWVEAVDLEDRNIHFMRLGDRLSLAVVVCEDLARQDPVFDVVRSIGPSLLVALLMDGPQLKSRWAARYATAHSDDPGCSVLTLTSRGMMNLSRPMSGAKDSRGVVALWKDSSRGLVELELPKDAGGLLLCLGEERVEEQTADGRRDWRGRNNSWTLTGVHPL